MVNLLKKKDGREDKQCVPKKLVLKFVSVVVAVREHVLDHDGQGEELQRQSYYDNDQNLLDLEPGLSFKVFLVNWQQKKQVAVDVLLQLEVNKFFFLQLFFILIIFFNFIIYVQICLWLNFLHHYVLSFLHHYVLNFLHHYWLNFLHHYWLYV